MRIAHISAAALALLAAGTADARDRAYTGGKECISISSIRAESAETDDRLIFHAGGSSAFINHLPARCDGLRGINDVAKLRLQPKGEQLCAGDKVLLTGNGLVSRITGDGSDTPTSCTLGRFEPISEMTLTEALRR